MGGHGKEREGKAGGGYGEKTKESGQDSGDAWGRNGGGMRGHGKEREGKTGGGYGTGKRRKWSERWGCLGGGRRHGRDLKRVAKENSG